MTSATGQITAPARELLALEAVRQLSAQFAADPDFAALMRLLLLTLSGQFGVPNLVAAVHQPGSERKRAILYAAGPFEKDITFIENAESYCCWRCLKDGSKPCNTSLESKLEGPSESGRCLKDDFVLSTVIPLVQKQDLFGFIGVGCKHSGEQLTDEEIELLGAMIDTVTPLLLNSYLLSEIRASSEWYESLLDNVRQGVIVFDAGGNLKLRNQAAASTMHEPEPDAGENAVRTLTVSDLLARIDMPEAVSQYLTGLTAEIPPACCVVDSESDRIYRLSLSNVNDCWSNSRNTVLMLDDVTEIKEAEADLLELERLAERGTMVASIAHEIRNVLAILKGSLELSQLVLKRGDVSKSENYLSRAIDSANHLERFAVELMDTRKLDPELRPAQLNDVITNVVMFLKVQRRFKGITLRTDLDPGLPAVVMDSDQISQLLLNLLNNSADAIRDACREEGRIALRTYRDKEGIVLAITDNGCGIPSEFRDKLFHQRFTTKKEGHGFGLVTCARVIANHKAQLRVASEPNVYTTISVIFPAPSS